MLCFAEANASFMSELATELKENTVSKHAADE